MDEYVTLLYLFVGQKVFELCRGRYFDNVALRAGIASDKAIIDGAAAVCVIE